MASIRIWLEATRPKTLSAALCPVMVGSALAFHDGFFDWRPASICLIFALLVQIGTNFANDYLDGIRGTDTKERIGPRRVVASGLMEAKSMKQAAIVVLVVAFCFGLLLIPFGGWWLLMVGVASVLCAWIYTGGPYPLAYNGLGDVFVVIFFGFVAVGCTYFVQSQAMHLEVLLAGLSCGLLINNILVVNNYRDCDEDLVAGKRTLVVKFGRSFARFQYLFSIITSALVTLYFAFASYGKDALWALIPLFFGGLLVRRLRPDLPSGDYLLTLKRSGQVVAAYGFVFSLAIIF